MDTSKISKLSKMLEDAVQQKAEADGALKQLLKDLEKEFDCKDLKSARVKLQEMEESIEKIEKQISEKMKKLEEEHDL